MKKRISEFWDWVTKNASYVPEESHKFLSELIARPADATLLAKTSSIQVKSRRRESQSNVLSSKLNSIKIKEKPEIDHKINESQVEERLSKGIYSNTFFLGTVLGPYFVESKRFQMFLQF